ncbi:MAG TPA: choice-of-anchor tandem repeat GloVer-containing protein [Capsulimonadaceae bacterium]|nr:choice-of-anchor tandem repeat GloVer-containing protein [Capsulimonadaceae bacterium]
MQNGSISYIISIVKAATRNGISASLALLLCVALVATISTAGRATATNTYLHWFGYGSDGRSPVGNLIYNSSANVLYGLTGQGGSNSAGTIYSVNLSTGSETILYNFPTSSTTSVTPSAGLALWTDSTGHNYLFGFEYSTTNSSAIVWKFSLSSNTLTTSLGISSANTGNQLMLSSDGNLYGTTYGTSSGSPPGTYGYFVKINPSTLAITSLYSFGAPTSTNLANPTGALLEDSSGNFYGCADGGGGGSQSAGWYGGMFELVSNGLGGFSKTDTNFSSGIGPWGGPILASNGTMYAPTIDGPGSTGEGTISNSGGGVSYTFPSTAPTPGKLPESPMSLGSDGYLYGTTHIGTVNQFGVLVAEGSMYQFNPTTNGVNYLVEFNGSDGSYGANPDGAPSEVTDGSSNKWIVGVTAQGGMYDGGVVYKYGPM